MIKVGDALPAVNVKVMVGDKLEDVTMASICSMGVTVIFAVPGAFTPACSARHLPGFLERTEAFQAKGVDRIICVAVNDAFVMQAWAHHNRVNGRVLMLADGNGDLTRTLGLESDARPWGMGMRSQRYAMIVENGKLKHLFVDEPGAFDVSSAAHVLSCL